MLEQTHKKVFSLKDVRLASLRGHVVLVEARKPTRIPRALFLEAARSGCVDYSEEMVEALKAVAAAAAKEAEAPPAVEPEIDLVAIAKEAVRNVMLLSDKEPALLSAQGLPRLPAVRKAFDTLCAQRKIKKPELKITSDMIALTVLEIQEESKVHTSAPEGRYPSGIPAGDLEGEEVGGLDHDKLEDLDNSEE